MPTGTLNYAPPGTARAGRSTATGSGMAAIALALAATSILLGILLFEGAFGADPVLGQPTEYRERI